MRGRNEILAVEARTGGPENINGVPRTALGRFCNAGKKRNVA